MDCSRCVCLCVSVSVLCLSSPIAHLCNGAFHQHLQQLFVPLVVRYIDLMESSIAQSIHRGFQAETWLAVRYGRPYPLTPSPAGGQRASIILY